MEEGESAAAAAPYRPSMEVENPRVENFEPRELSQCEAIRDMDDSMLVGVAEAVPAVDGGGEAAPVAPVAAVQAGAEVKVEEKSVGKRKRGRPPSGQAKSKPSKKKRDEEDVCFICFDGGKLVLCDRRGCPKAYHPACIKRDEAFFRSKARWNCGWHICSSCEKAAHYMCYTCTYSLCKVCIKEAEILCVRGNKGFCTTCMRTVMLIENNEQREKETVQVDFDDRSSWEYLFKVYWVYLKAKLCLTLDELTKAKNPWKEPNVISCKRDTLGEPYSANDFKCSASDGSSGNRVGNTSKRKKVQKQLKIIKEDAQNVLKSGGDKVMSFPEGTEWASKELLEFVAHMKSGDTSVLSQFHVQALLLEYIKRNNLRDPSRKSQIICDLRLGKLFGKERVGHFEMLKLLEFHFRIKEDPLLDGRKVGVVDAIASSVEADGNNDKQLIICKDKRHRTRKKGDNRGPQTNIDEYAAIDVHNINLIYLRRNLMENLIEDAEKFSEKVVGAVVRIRISSGDQKQDMYRLVQVVGISKVAVPYKVGQRTVDLMLEILNLDKKEAISIDAISNQEFSEDECKRLRQSIKCGLVKRLTVGEIQDKAMALRAVKLNDWLESEVLRLNHLRDRASEKGHRKELRECVEKLQLLNTPDERHRRLHEIPVVHADPKMNPTYDSEEDARESDKKKQDDFVRPLYSGFISKGRELSPLEGDHISNDTGNGMQKDIPEPSENACTSVCLHKEVASESDGRVNESSLNQSKDAYKSNNWENLNNQVDISVLTLAALASSLSTGTASSAYNIEIDRIWHYEDPNGNIQGPFSMVQLRKWSTTGFFPPDLKIWRITETQNDSVLLTDVLVLLDGQNNRGQPLLFNSYLQSQQAGFDDQENNWEGKGGMNATLIDGKQDDAANLITCSAPSNDNRETVRGDEHHSCSSGWSTHADINSKEERAGSLSHGWDSTEGNYSWCGQAQAQVGSLPSPTLAGKPSETLSQQQGEGHEAKGQSSDQYHGNQNSHSSTVIQNGNGQDNEKQSSSVDYSGQSSGQNWKPPPVSGSSNGCDSQSTVAKSSETSGQNHDTNFANLASPTPKPSNVDSNGQVMENKLSVASNALVQDSGPSWSSASSLVGGGVQLPEVAGEWGGYSPTPAKPSVEEWDSSLVSASLLKPSEASGDHAATPTSNNGILTHSSTSNPPPNTSSWPAIVAVPEEFSSLAEESVSDLLAEVDAMESLNGLSSPTSIMNCGGEFPPGSKNECFSPIEVLSPLDPGKSDALSSTGDLQLPFQSTITDEHRGVSHVDVLDSQKRSGGQSSTSAEVEGETKPSEVSVNQLETGSAVEPPASSTTSWDITVPRATWRAEPETADTGRGLANGHANLGCGGSTHGNTSMGWGTVPEAARGNENVNWSISAGNIGVWASEAKYGGERLSVTRDRGFPGGDSSFVRGRPSWNRQSSFGGGGGGSSRPIPKGQRVCKFYESGRCKKGARCDYLHP